MERSVRCFCLKLSILLLYLRWSLRSPKHFAKEKTKGRSQFLLKIHNNVNSISRSRKGRTQRVPNVRKISIAIEWIRNDDIYRGLVFHYYKRYKTELVDFHRGIHYASLIDSSITANWMIQLTGGSFTFWRIIITQWFRVINSIMPYCFGIIRYFNVHEFIEIPAYCKWDIRLYNIASFIHEFCRIF